MASGDRDPYQKFRALKDAARHARLPYERDWWLNIAFYLGHQYVEWYEPLQNLRRIPRTDDTKYTPRPVVNKINHFVQQQHSFALQHKPVPDVQPPSDSYLDGSLSQVALAYAQWAASNEVSHFPRTQSRATLWALTAGECCFKWTWDPHKKKPAIGLVNPFESYRDPYAATWEEVRYIIHSKFMDPEQVYDRWGVELKRKAERTDPARAKLLQDMGAAPVLEGVTVDELWLRPTRRHPEGRYAVWSGTEGIVAPQKLPYDYLIKEDRLPFTQIGVVPRPGSTYYDAPVKYLRPGQMELNKYHAQRIQIRENFAAPKWWEPEELQLQTRINNKPNQVLRGSGEAGLEPKIIQAAAMAENNEGEWIGAEMMNIVGLHEVSQAQVPGRVESAKAIELLKEADAGRLYELTDTTALSLAEGFWQIVMQAKQFEKATKLVDVYTPEGIAEVREFKAAAIKPGIRFKVTMGTGLAWSKANRTDQLLNLWDRGLFQDDPQRFLQLLDMGGQLPMSSSARDLRLARNENYTIARGQAVKPNSWDNHELHLREHNDYRKTEEYMMLAGPAKNRFEMHCQLHERFELTQLQKQALKAQIVAQGAEPAESSAPPEPGSEGGETGPQQSGPTDSASVAQ